jgi:hypothetical protein
MKHFNAFPHPAVSARAGAYPRERESPEGHKNDPSLAKDTKNDHWDFISVNNCLMWMSNNGRMSHNPLSRFRLRMAQRQRKVRHLHRRHHLGRPRPGCRVGGATYNAGSSGWKHHPDGTWHRIPMIRHRIYKIRKVDPDQRSCRTQPDSRVQMRDSTTISGPLQFGAPWKDKNKNGIYEPDFNEFLEVGYDSCLSDTPMLPGDETLYGLFPTISIRVAVRDLYGSQPIGIEVHTLVWAYSQTGPLRTWCSRNTPLSTRAQRSDRRIFLEVVRSRSRRCHRRFRRHRHHAQPGLCIQRSCQGRESTVFLRQPVTTFFQGPIVPKRRATRPCGTSAIVRVSRT